MAVAPEIARACVERYSSLPTTGKPSAHEWTVLAGIVLVEGDGAAAELHVVALGTGTKCLAQSVEDGDAAGLRVRDGHAERLAHAVALALAVSCGLDGVALRVRVPHARARGWKTTARSRASASRSTHPTKEASTAATNSRRRRCACT
jgi:hypothetical protein